MTTDQERTPGLRDHGREDGLGRNSVLHVIACFAIGALVMLAIQWLT